MDNQLELEILDRFRLEILDLIKSKTKELMELKSTEKPDSINLDRSNLKTIQSYSDLMGITRPTVYAWLKSGKLEHIKIDGVTFIIL